MSGVYVAAAIVAAGTEYYNNQQTVKRQDNEQAASLRQQRALQDQDNQKTTQLIQKTAQSNDAAPKANLLSQFAQAMQAKSGNATNGLDQAGNVSDAYAKSANDAALGISNYGNTKANLLSSIDAPTVQRQNEAADLSQYGSALGQIKQQSAADNFLSQMRLQGIRPNPWLTALSSAAGAYAKSGGGSTWGGSSTGSQYADAGGDGAGDGGFGMMIGNY